DTSRRGSSDHHKTPAGSPQVAPDSRGERRPLGEARRISTAGPRTDRARSEVPHYGARRGRGIGAYEDMAELLAGPVSLYLPLGTGPETLPAHDAWRPRPGGAEDHPGSFHRRRHPALHSFPGPLDSGIFRGGSVRQGIGTVASSGYGRPDRTDRGGAALGIRSRSLLPASAREPKRRVQGSERPARATGHHWFEWQCQPDRERADPG